MQADEGTEPYESTASPADEKSKSSLSGKMPCPIEGAGSITHLTKKCQLANESGEDVSDQHEFDNISSGD